MLSLQQALEVKESILAYLRATFGFREKEVDRVFFDFISHPENGMFKGPYLSLKLPFQKAGLEDAQKINFITPDFMPFRHQMIAWHRLNSNGTTPQSNIVTTGTGSGKTEAFLFPVLDYCYRKRHKKGIKAIILYPMNALATDQAKRIAEAIYSIPDYREYITAGLFIGEGKNPDPLSKIMTEDHIIENRDSIVSSPPDILLTNFKMLDYGLMKSEYHSLWEDNLKDRELLQYLILDELHTYDGAQGTDVANLIRRLKLKLEVPGGQLCSVGTSATIGSGEDAPQLLSEYASAVFGEKIDESGIVVEHRISPEEFFKDCKTKNDFLPDYEALKKAKPITGEGYETFILRQMKIWKLHPEALTDNLKDLSIFRDLVEIISKDPGIHDLHFVVKMLRNQNAQFKKLCTEDNDPNFSVGQAVVEALFALISSARERDPQSGREFPFLYTQAQLWIRELTGILRNVEDEIKFNWRENTESSGGSLALPAWFCRDCGASGWLGCKHDNKERFEKDVNDVYSKYFENHKHIFFISNSNSYSLDDAENSGYEPTDCFSRFVSGNNLEFYKAASEGRVSVAAFRKLDHNGRNDHICPECNTKNSLSIIGTRLATLCSIAVSQMLSSDLDKQALQSRKVLAFTNGVQDAAHQAGFIGSRNYGFTFRSSLQKVLMTIKGEIDLATLSDQFLLYWKAEAMKTSSPGLDEYYYRFFPKDYIGRISPENFKERNRFTPDFQSEFDLRMKWEVFAEFGYNALIGRTLEKTGSSATRIPENIIYDIWDDMQEWIAINDKWKEITKEKFVIFVCLLLYRLRTRGAIDHPYLDKFREGNLQLWDLNWRRDKRHFLNKYFGKRARFPKLITNHPNRRGVLDSSHTKVNNWFHQYFKKTFPLTPNTSDFINEFYDLLFNSLYSQGFFNKKGGGGIDNYAINPELILVSTNHKTIQCTECGHKVFSSANGQFLDGGHCLSFRCSGTYETLEIQEEENELNYYKMVYHRVHTPRIYTADHTGLLERSDREKLENDFKNRPNFNSVNAVVATSTLEMGIDIGSLNAVINNSIPPMPSNFLQRVGRAGRATGSSLILNICEREAHDLFYYYDPVDMMAGEIATPGCYLEAREILKRHFFAFCIDSWSSINPTENYVPSTIRNLKLNQIQPRDEAFFMSRILTFISKNEEPLFERFRNSYGLFVSDDTFSTLTADLKSKEFYKLQYSVFEEVAKELIFLFEKRKEISARIKDLKLGKEDDDRKEMEREIKNLGGVMKSINDRQVIEHLTNVGSLPNYAFPESGVTLNARVMGQSSEGSTQPPLDKSFEIVRPASQAIKEFAPDNFFYSQGFQFQITGINTFDWVDENIHKKRFCSKCDHIALEVLSKNENCPKCRDESWGAETNVHTFAKITSVRSYNSQSNATIRDNKDQREEQIFQIVHHFDFSKAKSRGGVGSVETAFGIEFCKNVKITDSNLGLSSVKNARRVSINSIDAPVHGFVSCKHCGKSSSNWGKPGYKFHYAYCKHKDSLYENNTDSIFEEVFFFREVETEVLKILLPVQELNSDSEVRMFMAGIQLGLKKYFKGNPDHIGIKEYKEFNHRTSRFDRYVLLYDTIPGGTGYLERIFDVNRFIELIRLAYQEIATCSCQHFEKDGCYRCIFTFSNQFHREGLSRSSAERRFKAIIDKCEDWESFPNGLSSITKMGQIEESELEHRFIRVLRLLAEKNDHWNIEDLNLTGSVSYKLTYTSESRKIEYHIQPQYYLGRGEGIKYTSRCDFMIRCVNALIDGKEYKDRLALWSFAVFLDGYQFHASAENNRFDSDLKKRMTIASSNEYKSWTLTWDDLSIFENNYTETTDSVDTSDFIYQKLQQPGFRHSRRKIIQAFKSSGLMFNEATNNLERLLVLMTSPIIDSQLPRDLCVFLGMFQESFLTPSYPPSAFETAYANEDSGYSFAKQNKTLDALIPIDIVPLNPFFSGIFVVNLHQCKVISVFQFISNDKIDKESWNMFWAIFNLIQFFEIRTETDSFKQLTFDPPKDVGPVVLENLFELFSEEYHTTIKEMHDRGLLRSTEDEESLNSLLDEKGNVIAEANLIIPSRKIAVVPLSERDEKIFSRYNYTVFTKDQIKEISL